MNPGLAAFMAQFGMPDYASAFDPTALGARDAAPSPGNAWGATVAPTLDPTQRPDVLNADGSRSSLLSMSDGTDRGELLYPGVTTDGRELDRDSAYDLAARSGQHLGIYSSVPMADQAAMAMHNAGAEQMSTNYRPTGWYRADKPGVRYQSQQERDFAQAIDEMFKRMSSPNAPPQPPR